MQCINCGREYDSGDNNFCCYECFKVYPQPLGAGDLE